MHSRKKPHVPMVHIQERAPENKWMRDAQVVPSPIHQDTGIVDAADLYRSQKAAELDQVQTEKVTPPPSPPSEVFDGANAQALERRTAAAAAEASRADKLEAEKIALKEKFVLTDKALSQAQEGMENSRNRVRILKTDLNSEKAKNKQVQKLLNEMQKDRRDETAEYAEKMAAAIQRIQELETSKPPSTTTTKEVEVEIYPSKIIIDEFTNTIRKGATIILKTQVRMDDELIPITIRAPFKKMKAAVDKADKNDADGNDRE